MVGQCAHCGAATAAGRLVAQVVSARFTGFDTWLLPASSVVCTACAWAFLTPALRRQAHLVHRTPPSLTVPSREDLAELLTCGPVDPGSAIVIPLRPGRKHVFAGARWGTVAIDDACLVWGQDQAHRLEVALRLGAWGFPPRSLVQEAAPFHVLRRLPRQQWARVLTDWDRLRCWRLPASPWLALAAWLMTSSSHPVKPDSGRAS